MSHLDSSLPEKWTERIFSELRATYGVAFDRQWECPAGKRPEEFAAELKAHWGRELRGFQQNPAAIAHALSHLPEHPPNLVQFGNLCRSRPEPAVPALAAPKANPERVKEVLGGIKISANAYSREWAHRLRAREEAGDRLTAAQRTMWRAAIGIPQEAQA